MIVFVFLIFLTIFIMSCIELHRICQEKNVRFNPYDGGYLLNFGFAIGFGGSVISLLYIFFILTN